MIHDTKFVTERFHRFADQECRGSTPLYEHLSPRIAEDLDLVSIARRAREGQPVPNLFFASVQFLLLSEEGSELAAYYPTLGGDRPPDGGSFRIFKSFCLERRAEIENLLRTRLVQTNVIRRSAYLFPAFCLISELCGARPLFLLELGTSAGINLIWDRFGYDYGEGNIRGMPESPVRVKSSFRGDLRPEFSDTMPKVASRLGVDLNVIELESRDERLWLRSLIWPEHTERVETQERAIDLLLEDPPERLNGDGVQLIPDLLTATPSGSVACVFHTHVANQISREGKEKLFHIISDYGKRNDVFHLYNNVKDTHLHLEAYRDGKKSELLVAKIDGHAMRISFTISRRIGAMR